MCDSSHSHCGHCAAYTAHRVESTTCGPDINSHQTVAGACTHLDTVCKSLQMTNAAISVELERLKLEVSRLKGMQPGGNYGDNSTTTLRPHSTAGGAPTNFCGTSNVIFWGNGAGAGSRLIYEEMCRTSWYGRLGRVHMADIDHLSPEKLKDLDDLLRQNIKKHFPIDGKVVSIGHNTLGEIWAGFKEIGLNLDERTYFADVTDADDHPTWPAMLRMRNRAEWCHQHHTNWKYYWNWLVNETLLGCARYRGLFITDGTLH